MNRVCQGCGRLFAPRFPNAKLCLSCWKRRELAFDEVKRLQSENDTLRRLLTMTEQRARDAKPESLPSDMLKLLLLLAHPDKHGNSAASTKATTWLLQQRGTR